MTLVNDVVVAVVCDRAHGFDPETGEFLWRVEVPHHGSATTDGERLYVAGYEELRAVDLGDRRTAWTATVDPRERPPAVAGDVLVGGSRQGAYALDASDGSVRWTRSLDHEGQFPAVADGTVYAGSRGEDETGRLYALSLDDGRVEWDVAAGGLSDEAPPAVTDDAVYLGNWHGLLRAYDRADGDERWTFEADDWLLSQPVVADGTVYAGSNDERVYAVDAADGSERWRFHCDDSAADTPVAGDSSLYATSVRYLFALRYED